MSTPKWDRIDAGYFVDPMDIIAAQRAQSAATKDGIVPVFKIIPNCPQPDEQDTRTRAYAPGQEES